MSRAAGVALEPIPGVCGVEAVLAFRTKHREAGHERVPCAFAVRRGIGSGCRSWLRFLDIVFI